MKATVLIDNIAKDKLKGEWGLSIFIHHGDKRILLDTGASESFAENAKKLGIPLEKTDFGVLSHAHYDHADGMEKFFAVNSRAKFYLSSECKENCYGKRWIFSKYIGIKKGVMEKYKDRISYVKGDKVLSSGVSIISHKTKGLEAMGKKDGLCIKENRKLRFDNFSHEQSLVIDTDKGLVIFNSCCHGGADTIITEVQRATPIKRYMLSSAAFTFIKALMRM